jgi:hypothetical protein
MLARLLDVLCCQGCILEIDAMTAKNGNWYALILRSGFAPVVKAELHALSIPVFPTNQTDGLSSSICEESAGTACIFARFGLPERHRVLIVPGVLCVAGVPEPIALDEKDVEDLGAAMQAGLRMQVLPYLVGELLPGRVLSGPLSGRIGKFLKSDGKWHFAIPLQPLEQTFTFAVHESLDVPDGLNDRRFLQN